MNNSPTSFYNCMHPIQFMANARDAFYKILKTLDFGKNKKILLPSYIGVTEREGSGVFDPIKRDAVPYQLYTLDKRLSAFEDELYRTLPINEEAEYQQMTIQLEYEKNDIDFFPFKVISP